MIVSVRTDLRRFSTDPCLATHILDHMDTPRWDLLHPRLITDTTSITRVTMAEVGEGTCMDRMDWITCRHLRVVQL